MLQQGGIFPKTQKSFDDSCNNVLHQSLDNTRYKIQDTRSLLRIFGPHMGHIQTRHIMARTKHNQGKNSK